MLVRCFYSGPVGGLPFVARVALVGWLLLCVSLVVSCSSFCLLMHSSPSCLFVTYSRVEHGQSQATQKQDTSERSGTSAGFLALVEEHLHVKTASTITRAVKRHQCGNRCNSANPLLRLFVKHWSGGHKATHTCLLYTSPEPTRPY